MSARRFEYNGQQWEALSEGMGVGAGSGGYMPMPNQWSFTFRCLSDPSQPDIRGKLPKADAAQLSEDDLARGLSRALDKKSRRDPQ